MLPPVRRTGWVLKGNPLHMGDKDRSCHDDAIAGELAKWITGDIVHLDERALKDRYGVRDFADTASIIAQCDLIVSIDSAVAHCAGAMGKPVLLLPPCAPEWRWGMPDTPGNHWYPTHTLFRRQHVNDWPDAIRRVVEAL